MVDNIDKDNIVQVDSAIRQSSSAMIPVSEQLRIALFNFLDVHNHVDATSAVTIMQQLYGLDRGNALEIRTSDINSGRLEETLQSGSAQSNNLLSSNATAEIMARIDNDPNTKLLSPETIAFFVVIFSIVVGNFYHIVSIVDNSYGN